MADVDTFERGLPHQAIVARAIAGMLARFCAHGGWSERKSPLDADFQASGELCARKRRDEKLVICQGSATRPSERHVHAAPRARD